MAIGAVVAIGAGLTNQAIGGVMQSNAARRAADAQLNQAEKERQFEMRVRQEDRDEAMRIAQASPQELEQINRAIQLNEQDIARKQKLIDSADPALIEAGQQALNLLEGEEAKTLDPIRRNRAEQKEKLKDRLRNQLGSGFETTTAGAQALNQYDLQTSDILAQEQSRTLGQLLGVAQNTANSFRVTPNVQMAGTLAQLAGRPADRALTALTSISRIPGQSTIQYQGAPFVGQALQGQMVSNTGKTLTNIGASYFGGGGSFGGGGGGGQTSEPLIIDSGKSTNLGATTYDRRYMS